ncbi:MAG: MBL fold metallo-hydrolase [Chloroflexi bacterium]|nr:MBL fold metallo-hydrolase [Chloroflexota bacterium]
MGESVKIGNVEVLSLLDMIPPAYDPKEFMPLVPAEAWAPYRKEFLESDGKLQLYYGCFALRLDSRVIMVDTGMGPGPHPTRGNRTGDLLNQMKQRGISPEDVDTVVHTHLHADHVGWNVTVAGGQPRPTFSRARYLFPRADWEYYTRPEVLERSPWIKASVVPLQGLGVVELIEEERTVAPGVSTLSVPGHTPGHLVVIINSRGEKGVLMGDVFHSLVQIQEPNWCIRADVDLDLSRRGRAALLDRMEREKMIVCAGHFASGQTIGKVVKAGGRRRWQAL